MISTENRVGRLVEGRLITPISPEEITQHLQTRNAVLQNAVKNHSQYVSCTDLRRMTVVAKEPAKLLIEMLKNNNALIERAAFLLSPNTLKAQVARGIRESGSPARRFFEDKQEMLGWLSEVLTPEEQLRLQEFLEEL